MTDQEWEDDYHAKLDREMMEKAYREDYEATFDDIFDGDVCPHCGSTATIRIDTICDDPVIWHSECADCEQGFEFIAGDTPTSVQGDQ